MVFYSLARWLLTVFAIGGLWMLWRTHRAPAAIFCSILLFFPLIYYLVNWSSRYRGPIEWLLVMLASVPIAWSWAKAVLYFDQRAGARDRKRGRVSGSA